MPHGDYRVLPGPYIGEVHGLVTVPRPLGSAEFSERDEASLVELGRQLGLALHNVRLDSALQASLDRLRAT